VNGWTNSRTESAEMVVEVLDSMLVSRAPSLPPINSVLEVVPQSASSIQSALEGKCEF